MGANFSDVGLGSKSSQDLGGVEAAEFTGGSRGIYMRTTNEENTWLPATVWSDIFIQQRSSLRVSETVQADQGNKALFKATHTEDFSLT